MNHPTWHARKINYLDYWIPPAAVVVCRTSKYRVKGTDVEWNEAGHVDVIET